MKHVFGILALALCFSTPAFAEDSVDLQSIVNDNGTIKITYVKNFATCAHLLTPNFRIVHVQNFFCATGQVTTIALPASSFTTAVNPGNQFMLCHGNNSNICSPLRTVSAPVVGAITSVNPAVAAPGSAVRISGRGFTGVSQVRFGGIPAGFAFGDDGTILAVVPMNADPAPVFVVTPSATLQSPMIFTPLKIQSITPNPIFQNSTLTIALNAPNPTGVPIFVIGGLNSPAFPVSPVLFQSPVQMSVSPGIAPVFMLSGTGIIAGPAIPLTVLPRVTVATISPANGAAGTPVNIAGSGFRPDTKVQFGSTDIPVTFVSPVQLRVVVPSNATTSSPFKVFHTFGGAGGAAVSPTFTIAVTPTITTFAPAQEAVGGVVVITGTHFTGATSVTFNGVVAPTFAVSSDTSITVTVPADATSGVLRVIGPQGTAVSSQSFTVNPLCNPSIDVARELGINDLRVVNDPRATFKPNDIAGSHWSFPFLMGRMAGIAADDPDFAKKTSDFILAWLALWNTPQVATESGALIPPRPAMANFMIAAWPRLPGTRDLDLSRAPMRLLAITNRLDLRAPDNLSAGEGRFVFGVLAGGVAPAQFTVILEYRLPMVGLTLNDWALRWHSLTEKPLGSADYLTKLQSVTDRFADARFEGFPNGSAISQVRTNELAVSPQWELREFRLSQVGRLQNVTVKQTPAFAQNNTPALRDWVNANLEAVKAGTHSVPARFENGQTFLDGSSPMPPGFRWLVGAGLPEDVRRQFSLNTCSGCHSGETGTGFLHVGVRGPNGPALFSAFLNGDLTQRATGPNGMRNLLIEQNCQ